MADKVIIETGGMLNDKHIYAAMKLIKKQFPHIGGLEPTVLCQISGFSAVSKNGIANLCHYYTVVVTHVVIIITVSIQIHFTGKAHWVTSAYVGEVKLYDSCVGTVLTKSLKTQLKQIYNSCVNEKDGYLMISEMPVQQQSNLTDCGIFSIAFAYHLALGDEPSSLDFDHAKMRQHLVGCFNLKSCHLFHLYKANMP